MSSSIFLGLMAGTSADGVDAALVDLQAARPRILAWQYNPYPDQLRAEILRVAAGQGDDLDAVGRLDQQIGRFFAETACTLLQSVAAAEVAAIGSHGQTIRHRVERDPAFTIQLGDPNLIAEITGITTVADFRRRDLAAGGQGAPLAPAFHAHIFAAEDEPRAVLNIGGMANLTLLAPGQPVTGFDTGPGNVLLDAWHGRHRSGHFDAGGIWGASGTVRSDLLTELLAHPFFAKPPPRSCGREEFNLNWLEGVLSSHATLAAADVQATLCQLTATSVAEALDRHQPDCRQLIICGGGAHNADLLTRLRRALPGTRISSSAEWGMDPDQIEAVAFAWLAQRTLSGLPGNLPAVTGADGPRVLGAIHPGREQRLIR